MVNSHTVAQKAHETMMNSAVMQNIWLEGIMPNPKDMRMEPLEFDFEVSARADRMYRSDKARAKRWSRKKIIHARATKLGKKFQTLSEAGHAKLAKRVMRMRDDLPHVRIRTN